MFLLQLSSLSFSTSAILVDVQEKIAHFAISKGFFVSELVGTFAYFAQTVVTVLYGIAVPVRGPADLSGRSVGIAFLYAVLKADSRNPALAVHIIGNGILVPVHNAGNQSPGIIFVLLQGTPAVPAFSTPYILNFSVQSVRYFCCIPACVLLHCQ